MKWKANLFNITGNPRGEMKNFVVAEICCTSVKRDQPALTRIIKIATCLSCLWSLPLHSIFYYKTVCI